MATINGFLKGGYYKTNAYTISFVKRLHGFGLFLDQRDPRMRFLHLDLDMRGWNGVFKHGGGVHLPS